MRKEIYIKILLLFLLLISTGQGQETELFDDFKQLLPRGDIPAIINPEFATADTAKIADSTWVLGIVINGQARAFSLSMLNHFEVVNDRIDTVSYAAVW